MKLIKITIILLTIAFVSCNKKTQTTNSRNDSVEKYLKLASNDTLPFDVRKKNNQKAFKFIDLERNDTMVRWYLCETGLNFSVLKDSANYYKVSKIHFKKAVKSNDILNLARFYRYRGSYHKNFTKLFDSSFYYSIKAKKLYVSLRKNNELAFVYLNIGTIKYGLCDYDGAEYAIIRAYDYFRKENNYTNIYYCFNELGNINNSLGKFRKSIKYHKQAIEILKHHKISEVEKYSNINTSLNNLGNSYKELKDYNKAIFFFNIALNNKDELRKDELVHAYLLNNIGYCMMQRGDYKNLNTIFQNAYLIFNKFRVTNEASLARMYLSEYFAKIKDTNNAVFFAEEAMRLAKESKAGYYYLCTLTNAGSINKAEAPRYIKEYHRLNDSLMFEERKARNQFFKIQLETDEITQEKEKAIKQKWVQTSIIATVLIIVILLFIIFKQRSQKKEFVLIQNQQKASEEIYQLMLNQQSKEEEAKQKEKKRIALELHDNVMNKLASTRFNLFTLTQKKDDQTLASAIGHIDKIKDIEDEIRNITHELSKETFFKSNSFTSLLTQLIEQQNQLYDTNFSLELDPKIHWDAISSEVKMNYYRIIQEAIHNTNKYAKASKANINLLLEENKLRLSISDNGKGFDTKANKQGIGIQNMHQRIAAINGEITINASPGNGTVINCSVEV